MTRMHTTVALAAVLVVGACASSAPTSPSPAATTEPGESAAPSPSSTTAVDSPDPSGPPGLDGDWILVEGSIGDQPIDVRPGLPLSITIAQTRLSGSAPCTAFRADIQVQAGGSRLGGLTTTPTACPDGNAPRVDAMFMAAMADIQTIAAAGDRLVLAGPSARLTFERI